MKKISAHALVLMVAFVQQALAQQPKQQPKQPSKPAGTVTGVFVGRSGKPMVKARLTLGESQADEDLLHASIKPVSGVAAATTDEKGGFQFSGVPPGEYTIVYQLAGSAAPVPAKLSIRPLAASTKSHMPLLRNQEMGRDSNYPDRVWGSGYSLLKGHTFWLEGPTMKIWNATARSPQGVYMEVRRGILWMQKLADKSQIKLDAWGY